jgi:hypothetical protein
VAFSGPLTKACECPAKNITHASDSDWQSLWSRQNGFRHLRALQAETQFALERDRLVSPRTHNSPCPLLDEQRQKSGPPFLVRFGPLADQKSWIRLLLGMRKKQSRSAPLSAAAFAYSSGVARKAFGKAAGVKFEHVVVIIVEIDRPTLAL